jgi:lipopolysaccharide transport system permease protein
MKELARIQPTTVYIKPSTGLAALNLRDLWTYRELVYFMIWREIKVRYKQTLLGAAWAVIQPVMTMLVFNFVFGTVAKVSTDGIPYPIFSYTALLPWGLFVSALNQASRSLTSNHNMITKIYFPRLVLPVSSVLSGLVDFSDPDRTDVLVSGLPGLARAVGPAAVSAAGNRDRAGCGPVAFGD